MKLYQELHTLPLLSHTHPPDSCFSEELQMRVFTGTRMELTSWDAYQNLGNTTEPWNQVKLLYSPSPQPRPCGRLLSSKEAKNQTKQTKITPQSCNMWSTKHHPTPSGSALYPVNRVRQTWPQVQGLIMSESLPFYTRNLFPQAQT